MSQRTKRKKLAQKAIEKTKREMVNVNQNIEGKSSARNMEKFDNFICNIVFDIYMYWLLLHEL